MIADFLFFFKDLTKTNLTASVLATTATTSQPQRLNSPMSLSGPRPTDEPTCGLG